MYGKSSVPYTFAIISSIVTGAGLLAALFLNIVGPEALIATVCRCGVITYPVPAESIKKEMETLHNQASMFVPFGLHFSLGLLIPAARLGAFLNCAIESPVSVDRH